jgi:hypothetical protein
MKNYYSKSIESISLFIKKHPVDYESCVAELRKFSKENFLALHLENNPIVASIKDYTPSQLEFIIKEYSGFSNEAIHMLLDAMIRNHDWKDLYQELQNNIDEEKGQETKGIPHLEMMRQGYKIDLGIDTDDISYSEITNAFLRKMRKIFKNNDNSFSAGALLAFEGTAIAEFHILDRIVKEYKQKKGVGATNENGVSLTKLYIDGHKDFEIGHEAHLMSSIKPYINEKNIHKMIRGYFSVCITMDIWWEQLSIESFSKSFFDIIAFNDVEEFSVSKVFENKK